MLGTLIVVNEVPSVLTDAGTFPLCGCKLTKHTDGSWNLNMTIAGLYTRYKEGTKVDGDKIWDKFFVWSLKN